MPMSTYYNFPKYLADGTIDWDTNAISATLHTSAYTPDRSHDQWSSVSASEIVHAGYTAGGNALTGKAVTVSGTDSKLSGTIPTWTATGATMTVKYLILRKGSGAGVGTDKLIGVIDLTSGTGFNGTVSTGKILSVVFSNGIFALQPGS